MVGHFQLRVLVSLLVLASAFTRLMFMELDAVSPKHLSQLMNNQHIVMVGDSLTRYQYLSLVYLVHYGRFQPDDSIPNILVEKTFKNWHAFYNVTNEMFAPLEYCDCFRNAQATHESRYYHNAQRNLSISYIQYIGDDQMIHGHWQPTDPESNHVPHILPKTLVPFKWSCKQLDDAIANIAAKLQPKPSVLLLNVGHWPNNWDQQSERVLQRVLPLFNRVIWKTTNYRQDQTPQPLAHDEICSDPRIECLNLDWTQYLTPKDYWNSYHFLPPIYTDINVQFIQLLITKQAYRAVSVEHKLHGQVVHCRDKLFLVDARGLLRPFAIPTVSVNNASMSCLYHLNNRTHVDMPVSVLVNHFLGERITNICEFSV